MRLTDLAAGQSLWPDVNHELLVQRDWAEYAEACLTHDADEPCVRHAAELLAATP
jgi:hypothetical protein